MPTEAQVAHVRSFNRVVTQRIGALDDRYLGRSRPLGQDRVLWEIGVEGCEVRSLRARLGLDAGHASRLRPRYRSSSAPIRWVTTRLKLRT